jgi:hypothetical protein
MIRPVNPRTSIANYAISLQNHASTVVGLLDKIKAEYRAKTTYMTALEDYATYLEGQLRSPQAAPASVYAAPTTARQWLDALDAFFSKPASTYSSKPASTYSSKPEQHKLWDVLTALRGPDSPENRNSVKSATTEVIRLHAFPNAAAYNALYGDFSADSELRVERRAKMPSVGGHFYGHAKEAFKALGLVWNRLNASIGSKGVEQEPTPLPISSFGNGNNDQFDTY